MTNAQDWNFVNSFATSMVWDVDMTAKEVGNWYFFNVDLREYQGQDIYVAIVHYNCTNQFMVNVDDIMLYFAYQFLTMKVMQKF